MSISTSIHRREQGENGRTPGFFFLLQEIPTISLHGASPVTVQQHKQAFLAMLMLLLLVLHSALRQGRLTPDGVARGSPVAICDHDAKRPSVTLSYSPCSRLDPSPLSILRHLA